MQDHLQAKHQLAFPPVDPSVVIPMLVHHHQFISQQHFHRLGCFADYCQKNARMPADRQSYLVRRGSPPLVVSAQLKLMHRQDLLIRQLHSLLLSTDLILAWLK